MTEPFRIRRMRRLPNWPAGLISISAALAIGLGVWLGAWMAAIPVVVIFYCAWYYHTRIRCPECSRRLRSRSVPLDEHGSKKQYFYDCPDCEVTWDPECITYSD